MWPHRCTSRALRLGGHYCDHHDQSLNTVELMIGMCFWLNGQDRDARCGVANIIEFVSPKVDLRTGVAALYIQYG